MCDRRAQDSVLTSTEHVQLWVYPLVAFEVMTHPARDDFEDLCSQIDRQDVRHTGIWPA